MDFNQWVQDKLLIAYLQWLPEQMECGNPQIRKSAVALQIPMTQKMIDTSFENPKCNP